MHSVVLVTGAGISPEARAILTDAVHELIVVDPAPHLKTSFEMADAR